MSTTLPLLVLASAGLLPSRLSGDLSTFSRAWGVGFEVVGATRKAASSPPDYSPALVERVEALLDRARTELASFAEGDALQALSEVERILHGHPELPQAAWLMAEHHSIRADLAERQGSPIAVAFRERALSLEGPRQAKFSVGKGASATPKAPTLPVEVRGLRRGDEVEWDGTRAGGPIPTQNGEHQLRILRDGRAVWAGWVFVSDTERSVTLDLPGIAPCSAEDLRGTRDGSEGPVAPPGATCPNWAVARRTQGTLEIALCWGARCGAFHRPPRQADPFAPPAQVIARKELPKWLPFLVAGVGAATLTGVVLWQTGAFAEPEPGRDRFVYRGPPDVGSEP